GTRLVPGYERLVWAWPTRSSPGPHSGVSTRPLRRWPEPALRLPRGQRSMILPNGTYSGAGGLPTTFWTASATRKDSDDHRLRRERAARTDRDPADHRQRADCRPYRLPR